MGWNKYPRLGRMDGMSPCLSILRGEINVRFARGCVCVCACVDVCVGEH